MEISRRGHPLHFLEQRVPFLLTVGFVHFVEDSYALSDGPEPFNFPTAFLVDLVGAEIAVDKGNDLETEPLEVVQQVLAFTVELLEIKEQFGGTGMCSETAAKPSGSVPNENITDICFVALFGGDGIVVGSPFETDFVFQIGMTSQIGRQVLDAHDGYDVPQRQVL